MPGTRPACAAIQRTGLGGWSQGDIAAFLKTGHNNKGVAFGSMLDVVNNSTPYLSDDDINAMAAYLKSLAADGAAGGLRLRQRDDHGARERQVAATRAARSINGYCVCLPRRRRQGPGAVHAAARRQSGRAGQQSVVAHQSRAERRRRRSSPRARPTAYRMPQYRVQLTDDEIASVVSFVRGAWGNGAPAVTADAGEEAAPDHRSEQRPRHHSEDALTRATRSRP